MSHNLKPVAVISLSLSEEEKKVLSKELKKQNYGFKLEDVCNIHINNKIKKKVLKK